MPPIYHLSKFCLYEILRLDRGVESCDRRNSEPPLSLDKHAADPLHWRVMKTVFIYDGLVDMLYEVTLFNKIKYEHKLGYFLLGLCSNGEQVWNDYFQFSFAHADVLILPEHMVLLD